jgi:hypothetical protein
LNAAAEGTLVYHTVVYHITYETMDCISKWSLKSFMILKLKKKNCFTELEAFIISFIGPHAITGAASSVNDVFYFGFSTEGSNHKSIKVLQGIYINRNT